MDKILINELQLDTVIGIYQFEKEKKQRLIIDLEIDFDLNPAAQDDDYNKTLCYANIASRIEEVITAKPIELIETVAEKIATCILTEFLALKVTVKVLKPGAIANCSSVGVLITRSL